MTYRAASRIAAALFLAGCAAPAAPGPDAVREVRYVHGAPAHGVPGPWALAGWRIGRDALRRLGLAREQAWEIRVTHRSERAVRYTCMMDGLIASTGASPGKMNLAFEEVAGEERLETIVRARDGRVLTYRLRSDFRNRIRPIDTADFPAAARMLEGLRDDEIFTVTESRLP